jgi:hypothetical protein
MRKNIENYTSSLHLACKFIALQRKKCCIAVQETLQIVQKVQEIHLKMPIPSGNRHFLFCFFVFFYFLCLAR